ncbi:MAG: serine/threonine-protein kinase, partial [Pseudonocardiaceae bacterium]
MTDDDLLHSRYSLVEVLGQGAMGVVWRAHDAVLDRDIALKELRPGPGVDPTEAKERFLVEARAAARLSHPNIVAVHDVFVDDDRVVIAMELVEGPTLEELVRAGAQPTSLVREVMAQVAQALASAHAVGVVHRDLKPDNIFWTQEGRAVVADFGLARIGAGRGTVEGTVMGTPGYMAPEQVRGTATGPQADVFGWAAVAYQLAAGSSPFGDLDASDPVALAYRIVHEDSPTLDLPDDPALAALITKGLAKDPVDRPADG